MSRRGAAAVAVIESGPISFDGLVRQVLRLKQDVAGNLWRMGKCLTRIEKSDKWRAKHKNWDAFTKATFDLTGHYCYKLMDVADAFSEQDVLECGATKLVRILPVPKEHRGRFLEEARTSSCAELRASLNQFTLERTQSEGRVLPTRESGRKHQHRTREVFYLAPNEQIVALYAGSPTSGTRAKRIEDRPAGRILIGGKAYIVSLRAGEHGLVLGVKVDPNGT